MDISKKVFELEFKALLVVVPLCVVTLLWAYSIHMLSGYMFNALSQPFLTGAL